MIPARQLARRRQLDARADAEADPKRLGHGSLQAGPLVGAEPRRRVDADEDLVELAARKCPCGRTLVAFEGGVLARLDDMKKVRGIIVYPRRIEELVRPHAAVDEFQIVFRRQGGLDDILVRVDPSPSLSLAERAGLQAELGDSLRKGLGLRATVEITKAGALPRWDHKAQRVKDERTEVPF